MKKLIFTVLLMTATLMASAQRYVDHIKFKNQAANFKTTYEIGFKKANISGITVPVTINIGTIKDGKWVSEGTFSIQAAFLLGGAIAEIKQDGLSLGDCILPIYSGKRGPEHGFHAWVK